MADTTPHLRLQSSGSPRGACAQGGHRCLLPSLGAGPAPPCGGTRSPRHPCFRVESRRCGCQLHFVVGARRGQLGFSRFRVASFVSFGLDSLAWTVRRRRKRAGQSGPFFCASEAPGGVHSARLFAACNPRHDDPIFPSSPRAGRRLARFPSPAEPFAASFSLNRDALDTGEGVGRKCWAGRAGPNAPRRHFVGDGVGHLSGAVRWRRGGGGEASCGGRCLLGSWKVRVTLR